MIGWPGADLTGSFEIDHGIAVVDPKRTD